MRAGGAELTYAELDALSDKVAGALYSKGVRKGDRVGIYLPKSLASLVSIYSILKAGGAYVPLDPDGPSERLAYIAKDCGIKTLLTSTEKAGGARAIAARQTPIETIVMVDCDGAGIRTAWDPVAPGVSTVSWEEARSAKPLLNESSIEKDTAYIIYTSGSTGIPKGVMISHRNSLGFVEWAAECVHLKREDIVACHAPLHFDISTFSIFSTCKAGGTVLMIPDRASTFPVELSRLIEAEKVTVWYSVPSVLTFLTLYGNLQERDLSRLRCIVFAGEVFPVKFLTRLMSAIPKARYFNWYGPTETNVCTSYEVLELEQGRVLPIPIGKACANTSVYLLTPDGRLITQPGEKGELYVRGPTVMQGYWGDLEKTNRMLVQDPLNRSFEEKVYKTGDIVALDENGDFLYFGRQDGMIKTRGYRVELGEIEAVIYSHPEVKEAVVVPVPDELIGNRMHAFITPQRTGGITKDEVLSFCGSKLPKYMVPDGISFMESLPKTSSGKMDRVALAQSLQLNGVKNGR